MSRQGKIILFYTVVGKLLPDYMIFDTIDELLEHYNYCKSYICDSEAFYLSTTTQIKLD